MKNFHSIHFASLHECIIVRGYILFKKKPRSYLISSKSSKWQIQEVPLAVFSFLVVIPQQEDKAGTTSFNTTSDTQIHRRCDLLYFLGRL